MAEAAGWIVATLVAVVAILGHLLARARHLQREASQGPPQAPQIEQQQAGIRAEAQGDLDALRDAYNSDNPSAAISEAANAAREQR